LSSPQSAWRSAGAALAWASFNDALAERGIRVSRGALDRLASDRPLKAINFELVLPILEELGITLGEPFAALPNDELERQQAARALGREAARNLANGDATGSAVAALVDEADLVLRPPGLQSG
jgi:hypothetical protein